VHYVLCFAFKRVYIVNNKEENVFISIGTWHTVSL